MIRGPECCPLEVFAVAVDGGWPRDAAVIGEADERGCLIAETGDTAPCCGRVSSRDKAKLKDWCNDAEMFAASS